MILHFIHLQTPYIHASQSYINNKIHQEFTNYIKEKTNKILKTVIQDKLPEKKTAPEKNDINLQWTQFQIEKTIDNKPIDKPLTSLPNLNNIESGKTNLLQNKQELKNIIVSFEQPELKLESNLVLPSENITKKSNSLFSKKIYSVIKFITIIAIIPTSTYIGYTIYQFCFVSISKNIESEHLEYKEEISHIII